MSYKFFINKECEYYPCHNNIDEEEYSCLYCYCPLYPYEDCGGNFTILSNGIKDCSNCLIPHNRHNYDYIVNKLKEKFNDNSRK